MRKLCLLLFALGFFLVSNAQFHFGVNAGASLASRSGYVSGLNSAPIITFQANIFARHSLGEKWLLHTELGYKCKGVQFKDWWFTDNLGNDIGKGDYQVRFNYIELTAPILLNISSVAKKLFRKGDLLFGAGPYFANAFNGKSKATHFRSANGNNPPTLADPDFDFNNRFDAGIVIQLTSVTNRLTGSLSFEQGLTNILKNSGQRVLNNSFGITLGFLFN